MTEKERLNQALQFLYTFHTSAHSATNLSSQITVPPYHAKRLLEKLLSDGLATKNPKSINSADGYQISSYAYALTEDLPPEFKELPYFYHLKIVGEKEEKERLKDEIDLKVKKITISNSKVVKYTPIVSASIAALSLKLQ